MISDLCGVEPESIEVDRVDLAGDFSATLTGSDVNKEQRANLDAICNRMRAVYRLKG